MARGSVGLGLATRQMSISSSQDRKIGKTIFVFLTLSLTLLLSNFISDSLSARAKHYFSDHTIILVEAVSKPLNAISFKLDQVKAIWNMHENQAMLVAENQRLMEWYQTANRLDSENKALRDLLKMKEEEALSFQSGKIIGDADTQYSHTVLVRLGLEDGLEKGQGVLSYEGLIGRVIETGEKTSRILLMTDLNSRIPVTIDGLNEKAILAGRNNGDPILDHLPENHKIETGQKVVTSGFGGVFPYGVPVGETYLTSDNQIAVKPYANPDRASFVQIVNYGIPAGSASRSVASSGTSYLR